MKVGDLVRILRSDIHGTIGMIVRANVRRGYHPVHTVEMYMPAAQAVKTRIWLEKDLELINESR